MSLAFLGLLVVLTICSGQEECIPGHMYPNPQRCDGYLMCLSDESGIVWQPFYCPIDTVFCEAVQDCTSETFCPCGGTPQPTTPEPTTLELTTQQPETTSAEPSCIPSGEVDELIQEYTQVVHGNSLYTFVYVPQQTWEGAMDACASNCSVLASLNSLEEYEFLRQLTESHGFGNSWIGGTNLNRTNYEWIKDDSPVPDFLWFEGEPNNTGGMENCTDVRTAYPGLNDRTCSVPFPFVCQQDLVYV